MESHDHHDHEQGPEAEDQHAGHEHPALEPPPLAPGDPGPRALEGLDPELGAAYLPDGEGQVHVERAENPGPEESFGFAGSFLEVHGRGGAGYEPGTLVMALDERDAAGVAVDTLRLFRWSDEERGFELVEQSALGWSRDYLWAHLTEPGVYGPIGVPTDPLVARTLAVLATLEDLTELDGLGGPDFLGGRICQLILCAPDIRERAGDPAFARELAEGNLRLGLPVSWGPTGMPAEGWAPAEGICERCLGIGFDRPRLPGKIARPPELGILGKFCLPRPKQAGRWDVLPVVPAPADTVLAVHAALLRTGKVVYFGGDENVQAQNVAGGAAIANTRAFDPATGTIGVVGSPANYDTFCSGHALMPDGRLLVAGGTNQFPVAGGHPYHGGHFEGLRNAAIFNPGAAAGANPWTAAAPLRRERGKTTGGGAWYPTLVTLPNGRVLRVAGHPEFGDTRHNNLMLETYDAAANAWLDEGVGADLPTSQWVDAPLYPRLHVLPDGHLFCATPLSGPPGGPSGESWKWNLTTKAWSSVGSGPGPEYGGFDTTSVLLPLLPSTNYRARVLMMNHQQPKIIDLDAAAPAWQPTAARALSGTPIRHHATSVLLPDATVLLVGGHSNPYNWSPPQLVAESFDPATAAWSVLAGAVVPRVYHSVALLLPDGRVWTYGSDYGAGNHEARMEVYSPPYLFAGPRPVISQAPANVSVNSTFTIGVPQAAKIKTVCLIRCGSSTHAFNSDQRYVGLVIQSLGSTQLTVAAPPNRNVAPPGCYLLFVLDIHGVPSVGRFVRVQ